MRAELELTREALRVGVADSVAQCEGRHRHLKSGTVVAGVDDGAGAEGAPSERPGRGQQQHTVAKGILGLRWRATGTGGGTGGAGGEAERDSLGGPTT